MLRVGVCYKLLANPVILKESKEIDVPGIVVRLVHSAVTSDKSSWQHRDWILAGTSPSRQAFYLRSLQFNVSVMVESPVQIKHGL
jgi:hypothetical protein